MNIRIPALLIGGAVVAIAAAAAAATCARGSGQSAAIAADHRAIATAEAERRALVDTVRIVVRVADSIRPRVIAIHDTVRVADSTHLEIRLPGELTPGDSASAPRDSLVSVPAAVTRRLVLDSIAYFDERTARLSLAQLVVADSNVIHAQAQTITDLERTRRPRFGVKTGVAAGLAIGAGIARPDLAVKAARLLWRLLRP